MTHTLQNLCKNTLKNTLPDNRDNGGIRGVCAPPGDSDDRRAGSDGRAGSPRACRACSAVVPLAGLALAIGLATTLLEPCLAAAGLPGIGAMLAAALAALFAVLLAIVSVSVAAAIAALLLPLVAGAALYTAFYPPWRRPRARAGPPGAGASRPAATLAPSPRDPP